MLACRRVSFPASRPQNIVLSLPLIPLESVLWRGRTNPKQWPSAGGIEKASHAIPQASLALQPLWPLTIWSWSGPVSLAAAQLSPARDRRFPGIPAWPYGHGFAAALGQSLPPPALWFPEGHLAEIQINGVLASIGKPLICHKTA